MKGYGVSMISSTLKEIASKYLDEKNTPIANNKLVGGAAKGDFQGSITLPIPSQISDTNSTKFGQNSLNSFYAAGLTNVLNITGSESVEDLASQLGQSGNNLARLVQDRRVQGLVKLFAAQQAISSLGANLSLDQLLTRATGSIINRLNGQIISFAFLIVLKNLNGLKLLDCNIDI